MRAFLGLLMAWNLGLAADSVDLAKALGVSFPPGKDPVVMLNRDGKTYLIDAASHSIRELSGTEAGTVQAGQSQDQSAGRQLFMRNCAVCHGPAGQGKPEIGSRDLTNRDFQKNTSDDAIGTAIRNGTGKMPPFGTKLSADQIATLTAYVRTLYSPQAPKAAEQPQPKTQAGAQSDGQQLFAKNCAVCHGPGGQGKPEIGSRDLTNRDFQKNTSDDAIGTAIRNGTGKMPPFGTKLSADQIATLTAYVRTLNSPQAPNAAEQPQPKTQAGAQPDGQQLFAKNCAVCHGPGGQGKPEIGSRNLTDPGFQKNISDTDLLTRIRNGAGGTMPAFEGKLSQEQIATVAAYVRTLNSAPPPKAAEEQQNQNIYKPGDDVLFTLPTGRPVDEHAVIVNFTHRFVYDSAFTGQARGAELFGLDNFAISSFGFRYGVTDRLSVDVYRSPSFIGRPIELLAAYNLLEERHGAPLNLTVRGSIDGQDNFRKNFSENVELIASRSLGKQAQFYVIPTASFNDRPLVSGGLLSNGIPDLPGVNAFSIGIGAAWDVRPTIALVAEVIPTVVGETALGIHRPPFSFGIQKKLYRHAFTFGFSTSPGTTVAQRAGTRATFLGLPSADTPGGLFIGFDITRQIH